MKGRRWGSSCQSGWAREGAPGTSCKGVPTRNLPPCKGIVLRSGECYWTRAGNAGKTSAASSRISRVRSDQRQPAVSTLTSFTSYVRTPAARSTSRTHPFYPDCGGCSVSVIPSAHGRPCRAGCVPAPASARDHERRGDPVFSSTVTAEWTAAVCRGSEGGGGVGLQRGTGLALGDMLWRGTPALRGQDMPHLQVYRV